VGIGAATAGSLTSRAGWDFVLAVLAAGGAGLVAALVLGLPALRLRGFFLAVTTLAFAVTTSTYFLRLEWFAPDGLVDRPLLFGRIDLRSELAYYYVCLAVLALVMVMLRGLRTSRVGRAIVGVRDNPRAAQSYGISPVMAKLIAFGLSGAIAGVAGGLLVHQQYRLQLVQYEPAQSLQAFTMAVIGGLGSLPGAVLGAVFVKGSQNLLQGPWVLFGTGFGLIVVLLVLPRGLGSLIFTVRDGLLRAVARRRGIVVASLLEDRRQDDTRTAGDVELEHQPLGRTMAGAGVGGDPA
jgi:branched-chain amino acid transport system permease protein